MCAPAFTLPRFPLEPLRLSAYRVEITAVLDHSSRFYTQCCDTEIAAYTGETVVRGTDALCPVEPVFPVCFFQICVCSYPRPDGEPFGWTGAGPDPIAENPQAAVQEEPACSECGNGRRECGEGCDDGNSEDGDGCSAGSSALCHPRLATSRCSASRRTVAPTAVGVAARRAEGPDRVGSRP